MKKRAPLTLSHVLLTSLLTLVIGLGTGIAIPSGAPTKPTLDEKGTKSTSHIHETIEVSNEQPLPTVTLEVIQGPDKAWNAHMTFENFVLAPDQAGAEHVEGQGHAHIYLDGKKINRVYGNWYHLGKLQPGEHDVEVTLSTNNHFELVQNGKPIGASQKITVTELSMNMQGQDMSEIDADATTSPVEQVMNDE